MKQDEDKTGFADSLPDAAAEVGTRGSYPTITGWSVAGYDRIVGTVYGHRGQADGKTIITSPVLQVVLADDIQGPLARTQSGSLYTLGQPSGTFGVERAGDFLAFKSRTPAPAVASPPDLRTSLLKIDP